MLNDNISELINAMFENDSIVRCDDGFYVFFPKPETGAFTADNLRRIADKLDEMNYDYGRFVRETLEEQDDWW